MPDLSEARRLLQGDLDRLIELSAPETLKVECDAGGEECIAMVKEGFRDARRKYVIVRREDFEMIKRELEQFRPALEGNLWLTASSVR